MHDTDPGRFGGTQPSYYRSAQATVALPSWAMDELYRAIDLITYRLDHCGGLIIAVVDEDDLQADLGQRLF